MSGGPDPNDPPSGASPKSELKQLVARSYVREMLDLNPMFQSPQILRRRRETWHHSDASDTTPAATVSNSPTSPINRASASIGRPSEGEFSARAKACLEKLRTKFYELPDETLQKYLRVISSPRVPQYAAVSARLRAVAAQRQTLLQVPEETGDVKFAYSLQFAMIGTAAQGGALREQYIESLIAERRVAEGAKIVKMFIERHPTVYAIDHDWFDALIDPENQRDWSANYSTLSRARRMFARPKWSSVAWAVFIAMVIINAIVQDEKNPRQRGRSLSSPNEPADRQSPETRPSPPAASRSSGPPTAAEPSIPKAESPDPFTPAFPSNQGSIEPPLPDASLLPPGAPEGRKDEMPQLFRDLFPGVERLVPERLVPANP